MRPIYFIIILSLIFINGCESKPPPEDIISVVNKLVAACLEDQAHDQNCEKIPHDADLNSQVGEVEIINSKTAVVEWIWKWGINRQEKYELTVADEGGWRVAEIVMTESMRREKETIRIEPQIQEQFDQNLWQDASYVLQEGLSGEKVIVTQITQTAGIETEEVVSDEVVKEPTDWIVVKGTLTEKEIKGDVTRLVRDYFKSYQAGDFHALEQLAPDAAKYDYQAALYINDFSVTLAEEIKIINSKNQEPKRADINQSPINEPFTLQAQVPIQVSYNLFGIEFTSHDNLLLKKSTDDERWTMPFWGVTKAVSLDQSVTGMPRRRLRLSYASMAPRLTLNANTITLDGFATTHDSTLIALTVSQNQPTTMAIEGYEQTDELINFTQFPRAYKWIGQLPEQEELTITLSSGSLVAKTDSAELTVNLSQQTALPVTSASGVQGRVEWGPT